MSKKNSTNVRTAETDSRTRMRLSVTKILSISAAIRGPALRFLVMRQPFTPPLRGLATRIHADIVDRIFHAVESPHHPQMCPK